MPDDNHTDMPTPEDMNFPDTMRITIALAGDAVDEAVEAVGAAEEGEQSDVVVSFETVEGIRKLLTDRRLELLGRPAESITKLADRLGRSYSAVHEDVEILAESGIVQYHETGQSKQPFVPYEPSGFDVAIHAPLTAMTLNPRGERRLPLEVCRGLQTAQSPRHFDAVLTSLFTPTDQNIIEQFTRWSISDRRRQIFCSVGVQTGDSQVE